jgi:hypothetical protein
MKGARGFIAVSLGQLVKFIIGDTNTRLAEISFIKKSISNPEKCTDRNGI